MLTDETGDHPNSNIGDRIVEKLALLSIARGECRAALDRNRKRELVRYEQNIEKHLSNVYDLKDLLSEEKIQQGESIEDVKHWGEELQNQILPYEDFADEISDAIKEISRDEISAQRDEIAADQNQRTTAKAPTVKLPKLEVTKFNGTYIDWPRFWNIFEVEVDRNSIPTVTKLNYLKEFCVPKVRMLIEGLPYSAEGYERAKNILKSTWENK